MPQSKTCPQCGKTFTTKDKRQFYCSKNCSIVSKSKQVECTCLICGKKTLRQPAKVGDYCSRQCAGIGKQIRIPVECAFCGKPFETIPSRQEEKKYCSSECHHADRMAQSREVRQCSVCGKAFDCYKVADQFCCSPECASMSRRNQETYTCVICGKEYNRPASRHIRETKYCSHACASVAKSGPRAERETRLCQTCSKEFEHLPGNGKGLYCSRECRDIGWAEHLRKHIGKRGATRPERITREALDQLGLAYEAEKKIHRYVIDFYLPHLQIALEVDGDYWHSIPKVADKDSRKDKYLTSKGYQVVRISESDINAAECVTTLVAQRLGLID